MVKGRPALCLVLLELVVWDAVSVEDRGSYLETATIRKRATAVPRMIIWTRSKRMASILAVADRVAVDK